MVGDCLVWGASIGIKKNIVTGLNSRGIEGDNLTSDDIN